MANSARIYPTILRAAPKNLDEKDGCCFTTIYFASAQYGEVETKTGEGAIPSPVVNVFGTS
jgi:hypothetical protein